MRHNPRRISDRTNDVTWYRIETQLDGTLDVLNEHTGERVLATSLDREILPGRQLEDRRSRQNVTHEPTVLALGSTGLPLIQQPPWTEWSVDRRPRPGERPLVVPTVQQLALGNPALVYRRG